MVWDLDLDDCHRRLLYGWVPGSWARQTEETRLDEFIQSRSVHTHFDTEQQPTQRNWQLRPTMP
jgi:hypothetical protein